MYQINLQGLDDVAAMAPFHKPAHCDQDSLDKRQIDVYRNLKDIEHQRPWRPRWCMFSKLLRGIILNGRGPALNDNAVKWLKSYYVGASHVYDYVMKLGHDRYSRTAASSATGSEINNDKNIDIKSRPLFDFTLHLRTLDMIETHAKTSSGVIEVVEVSAEEAKRKAEEFVNSSYFNNMMDCFTKKMGDDIFERFQVAHKVSKSESSKLMKSGVNLVGGGRTVKHATTIRIFLASDSADIKPIFASRLKQSLTSHLMRKTSATTVNSKSSSSQSSSSSQGGGIINLFGVEVAIEVEYFSPQLPPAHFFLWLKPLPSMDVNNWNQIVGTVGEWFFLSHGRKLLSVKGTEGGMKASASSFAMSAAGFGQSVEFSFLEDSKRIRPTTTHVGSDCDAMMCEWSLVASFD
jgi:hypothetical protein